MLYVDYRAPVGIIRDKLREIVQASKNWDGGVVNLQVTDARETTIELRCLMSARSAGQAFDLRCEVREQLIDFLQSRGAAAPALGTRHGGAAGSQGQDRQAGSRGRGRQLAPGLCSACCVLPAAAAMVLRNSSAVALTRLPWARSR